MHIKKEWCMENRTKRTVEAASWTDFGSRSAQGFYHPISRDVYH